MDITYYKQFEPIFGSWKIDHLIGEGSFGKVFEITREDFGVTYKAALKAITIPQGQSEARDLMLDSGMSEKDVSDYYYGYVEELVKEFDLMAKLKGNSNIVSYEDHQVIRHTDGIGWDIFIRMELLTPLNEYIRTNQITKKDIIKLGIDICKALTLCQKHKIIHRDIKPENIFISADGEFKLGDFGIARTVERSETQLSKKGTSVYMAPEVYRGENYGTNVDIYSLGLVLYKLLNNGRLPFLPAAPNPIKHSDRESALARRMSGEQLPCPADAEGRLAEIVLRACAFDPADRYTAPLTMQQELEAILYNDAERPIIYPEGDEARQYPTAPQTEDADGTQKTIGRFEADATERTISKFDTVEQDKTVSRFAEAAPKKLDAVPTAKAASKSKSKPKTMIIATAAAAVVIVGGIVGWNLYQSGQEKNRIEISDTAYSLYTEGKYQECETYVQEQMTKYPQNADLLAILASAEFELSDYQAAADCYKQLSDDADYDMKISNLRDYAVCLARLNRLDEAATIVVLLTDKGATADVTDYVLGETYYAKSEYDNAEKQFRKVLQETDDDTLIRRSYMSLAETFRDSGNYTASIDIIQQAVALPQLQTNSVLQEMLGAAYYAQAQESGSATDYETAAAAFERTINLGMQKDYLYVNAYICYQNAESYTEAANILDAMQSAYPSSYVPLAYKAILSIVENNAKSESERNYNDAYQLYLQAQSMATSNDDQTVLQQLQGLIEQLQQGGWI